MLDTMSSTDDVASQGPSLPSPAATVAELLQVVPRLVDRTRRQADLARSLLGALPCFGGSAGGGAADASAAETPAVPEHEQVDVLSVLADDDATEDAAGASRTASSDTVDGSPSAAPQASAGPAPLEQDAGATPTEAELPIQDYDSLAASQVVPRLATLAPAELMAVQRYEQATRHRQTILHRVAQLLSD
jgi:hypothetical protein